MDPRFSFSFFSSRWELLVLSISMWARTAQHVGPCTALAGPWPRLSTRGAKWKSPSSLTLRYATSFICWFYWGILWRVSTWTAAAGLCTLGRHTNQSTELRPRPCYQAKCTHYGYFSDFIVCNNMVDNKIGVEACYFWSLGESSPVHFRLEYVPIQ